jgi:hypothetical protein
MPGDIGFISPVAATRPFCEAAPLPLTTNLLKTERPTPLEPLYFGPLSRGDTEELLVPDTLFPETAARERVENEKADDGANLRRSSLSP